MARRSSPAGNSLLCNQFSAPAYSEDGQIIGAAIGTIKESATAINSDLSCIVRSGKPARCGRLNTYFVQVRTVRIAAIANNGGVQLANQIAELAGGMKCEMARACTRINRKRRWRARFQPSVTRIQPIEIQSICSKICDDSISVRGRYKCPMGVWAGLPALIDAHAHLAENSGRLPKPSVAFYRKSSHASIAIICYQSDTCRAVQRNVAGAWATRGYFA